MHAGLRTTDQEDLYQQPDRANRIPTRTTSRGILIDSCQSMACLHEAESGDTVGSEARGLVTKIVDRRQQAVMIRR
jgi:hypothetical protein